MPDLVYLFWGLIPLGLLIVALITFFNNMSREQTNEYVSDYMKQFCYTAGLFVVFIVLDKTVMPAVAEIKTLKSIGLDPIIIRWLIYPALLVLAASIQQHFDDQKVEEEQQERRKRQMRWASK